MPEVSGHVTTPGGKPLPGVHVIAWDRDRARRRAETHTDHTGTWRLELPAGAWTIREAGHDQHQVTVADTDLDVTEQTAQSAPTVGETGQQEYAAVPDRDTVAALLARRRAGGD